MSKHGDREILADTGDSPGPALESRREWLTRTAYAGAAGAFGMGCAESQVPAGELREPKRAVTGRDATGRSVFKSFGVTPRVVRFDSMPGLAYYELYGTTGIPTVTGQEPDPIPEVKGSFPAPGGTFFRLVLFPPAPEPGTAADPEAFGRYLDELERKVPGMAEHFERDEPGMHTSTSLDYVVVIRGEIDLELDDGQTVRLGPGDCVVQNGTRHRWRNALPEPCLIAGVMIGATRG